MRELELVSSENPVRICVKCRLPFPADRDHFYGNRGQLDSYCKECRKACSRSRPERSVRDTGLRTLYGITIDEYEALYASQKGVCKICGGKALGKKWLSVDHDPTTGRIRGLLCDLCNRGIGMFRHDPERLLWAISYLRETEDALADLRLFSTLADPQED